MRASCERSISGAKGFDEAGHSLSQRAYINRDKATSKCPSRLVPGNGSAPAVVRPSQPARISDCWSAWRASRRVHGRERSYFVFCLSLKMT